jgi:hypothetical protein
MFGTKESGAEQEEKRREKKWSFYVSAFISNKVVQD